MITLDKNKKYYNIKQFWRQQKNPQTMDYFNTINAHYQGQMDIDAITSHNNQVQVISIGSDDLVRWRNLSNTESGQMELENNHGLNKIAFHPSGGKFLAGGQCKKVFQYSIATKSIVKTIYESLGKIRDIKYSSSGRFISVATDQQKVIVIDTQTNRQTKCRPGHSKCVLNTFFSSKDKFVASIGQDLEVLIYQLSPDKDPQQVFRTKFTNTPLGSIQGCFHEAKEGHKLYLPGTTNLQVVEQLTNRWQIKKTLISHSTQILVCQAVGENTLITCCQTDLCTWSINKQQKLIVLQIGMRKIIPIPGSFIGNRNDGILYIYNRTLQNKEDELESKNNLQDEDQINFDNKQQDNIELQFQEMNEGEQENIQEQQLQYKSKKRLADKIIKAYPQIPLNRTTTFFEQHRFLFMNNYGYIIENIQLDETKQISVQMRGKDSKQQNARTIFKNREFIYFDLSPRVVCYANQNQFGVTIDFLTSWEKDWFDIQSIALGASWVAVSNSSEIRIFDLSGNFVRAICFDRLTIAMQAYQNLLVVVYHTGIPLYQSQLLSMKIFNINQFQITSLPQTHVPLTISEGGQKGSTLKWFGFSSEGMIFSQDSYGSIRAYSLQTNQWTPIVLQANIDQKKTWIIGFQKYEIKFWRMTQSQPEPTVRPRLNIKQSKLMISTLNQNVDQLQTLPNLMWQRYCLDHQLARFRLWGHLKFSRTKSHLNYQSSINIKNEKQLHEAHLKLDSDFYPIILYFLKSKKPQKAVDFVKSHIRLNQTGKNLIQIFDQIGRQLSIQLQLFYDQKDREAEYQKIQELCLNEIKSKIQTNIKSKKQNPMNPKFKRPVKDPIPSQNLSSYPASQNNSIMQDITQKSQDSKIQQVNENPFLKKKSTNDRKQEIQEHIEKFAVKRKAQQKKKR